LQAGLRAAVCCCALLAGAPAAGPPPAGKSVRTVYLDGRPVAFDAAPAGGVSRGFEVGPWRFGRRIRDPKPRDGRLNLYIVSPGSQYVVSGAAGFGFNCVINSLSKPGVEPEWDVYWAIVLDPALAKSDMRDEHDLIRGTEAEFTPDSGFALAQAPGKEVLRRYLKVEKMEGLERFRRKSGALPRVILVPSGSVLRARAEEITEAGR
jgi:hypothetical protein